MSQPPIASVAKNGRAGTALALAAAALLGLTAVAQAQDNEVSPPVLPPQPGTGVPEKVSPPASTTQEGDVTGTLSQKLDKSEGVIKPPAGVDPEIRVQPPETGGVMPVIPPPGEPGGNPQIQPK